MYWILSFTVVEPERPAADGQYRRRLNSFGNAHAGIKTPPSFEIGDEIGCRRKNSRDQTGLTAKILLDRSFPVPRQQIFRRGPLPAFDERAEQIVVIGIYQRIAFAGIDILLRGQLGTGDYGKNLSRYYRPRVDLFVEPAAQGVDLMFPKVGQGGQTPRFVAI